MQFDSHERKTRGRSRMKVHSLINCDKALPCKNEASGDLSNTWRYRSSVDCRRLRNQTLRSVYSKTSPTLGRPSYRFGIRWISKHVVMPGNFPWRASGKEERDPNYFPTINNIKAIKADRVPVLFRKSILNTLKRPINYPFNVLRPETWNESLFNSNFISPLTKLGDHFQVIDQIPFPFKSIPMSKHLLFTPITTDQRKEKR